MSSDSVNEEQPIADKDALEQDSAETTEAPAATDNALEGDAPALPDADHSKEPAQRESDPAQDARPASASEEPVRPKKRIKRADGDQAPSPKRPRHPRPSGAKKAPAKQADAPAPSQPKDKVEPPAKAKAKPKHRRRPSPDTPEPNGTTKATPSAASDTGAQQSPSPTTASPKGEPAGIKPPKVALPKVTLPKVKAPTLDDLLHPTLVAKIAYGVALVWFVGVVFFWPRFLPGTVVNGTNVSWKTIHTVAESFGEVAKDYNLKVQDQGLSLTISGSEIDLAFDQEKFEDASTHRLQKVLWPIALFLPKTYDVTQPTTYREDRLRETCQQAVESVNAGAGNSVNATIAYDEASGAYVGIPESQGTRLDNDAVLGQVSQAVSTLQETLRLTKDVLEKPTVVEGDPRFAAAVEKAQSFPALSIDLRLSNIVVATVDETHYRSWLTVSDDYDVCANTAAIEEWTRGELSEQLDSVGKLRTWTRWDEKACEVYDGTYGWNIDGSALATEIASRLDERSEVPIEVPCTQRAALYNPGGPDWGNRYIEVDMTEQYAYMYDEGGYIIWQSECVTGNVSKNDGTVLGVYAIEKKKSPEKLVGLDNNGDGEPDYENDVDFWMPFYGGYGLHDAIWRDTFDYDTYLTDGSHGCVNLPYYAAASLYELCEIGDPVVVHW